MSKFRETSIPKLTARGPAGVNEFYTALGWRKNMLVDQAKVVVNPHDYASICLDLGATRDPEERALALSMWLFCGPRPDGRVPRSTVRMYPGCFISRERTA